MIILFYITFVKHYTLIEHATILYRILLIPTTFNVSTNIYDGLWFLTVLIVVETFMFPLIVKYKKNFIYIISPIIVIFLINYILIETKILVSPWTETPIALKGMLRGFLVINIGMYIYLLSEKFNNIKLTKLSKIILAIIEILIYLSVFYIVNIPHAHIKFDVFMLMLLSVGLLISLNPNVYLTKLFNNENIYFLEKLSLPMYIYQWVIICAIKEIFKVLEINLTYWTFILFTIPTLIIMSILVLNLIKLYNKNRNKILSLFIKTESI